jgi:hypothetical protein
VTGTAATNVAAVLTPPAAGITASGSINVVNNSPTNAHVAATQTGTGVLSIVNNGGVLTATNTSTGAMTINSNATGAVTVTNSSGKGNITVNATGSSAIACTYTDGLDHNAVANVANPACLDTAVLTAGLGSSLGASTNPNVTVSGANAGNVAAVVTGGGFINVTNNGAHVAATQTGTGTINVVNNGQVMAATNTGMGIMTITSNATGAVAVTRTGNGNTTVNATGSTPIALSFSGDGNVSYPIAATAVGGLGSSMAADANTHITVTGITALDVAPVLTGGGSINVANNGAHVAATQTGTGAINIVNNGLVMAATNTGSGTMTINSTDTGAVTVTQTGNGDVTVNATGTTPLTLTFADNLPHVYPGPTGIVGLGGALGNPNIIISGSNAGAVTATLNDPTGVGSINITNNGTGFDTATETGTGTITIANTGAGVTATNNGNGAMTINSSATAAVTVTNTGNGSVMVNASGSNPITLTHNGNDNFTYTTPATTSAVAGGGLGVAPAPISPVTLGTAGNFEILSSTGITDVGASVITGNIGASPITAAAMNTVLCTQVAAVATPLTVGSGFIYGVDAAYVGACYKGTAVDKTLVDAAVINMQNAYNYAADATLYPATATELLGGNIATGTIFAPGVYKWSTPVVIPAGAVITLTGAASDVWVFQVAQGVALTGGVAAGSGAKVVMAGGALAKNVFWQVAGVMALGTNTTLNGVVLSKTGITLAAGAVVHGKLMAQTSVTLSGNTVAP